VHFPACWTPSWPWTLTFWIQNLKRSSLSQKCEMLKVWCKYVQYFSRYCVSNVRDAQTDRQTHVLRNSQKTLCLRPHIVHSVGMYNQQLLQGFHWSGNWKQPRSKNSNTFTEGCQWLSSSPHYEFFKHMDKMVTLCPMLSHHNLFLK